MLSERPDFSGCVEKAFHSFGEKANLREYTLTDKFKHIDLSVNESTGELKMKGCMGYFLNGHNLYTSFSDFRQAIDKISKSINVDLFTAEVKQFDHSCTVISSWDAKYIIQNHLGIPKHFKSDYKHGKRFTQASVQRVQIYDARRRLLQMCPPPLREEVCLKYGILPSMNLIRFEKKIFSPKSYFKKTLIIEDLLNPSFIHLCNSDLLETYHAINKAPQIEMPKSKKQLTSATLPLLLALELGAVHGFDFAGLLRDRISSIDTNILSKDDKKARKRVFNRNLKKITGAMKYEYDLGTSIDQVLREQV